MIKNFKNWPFKARSKFLAFRMRGKNISAPRSFAALSHYFFVSWIPLRIAESRKENRKFWQDLLATLPVRFRKIKNYEDYELFRIKNVWTSFTFFITNKEQMINQIDSQLISDSSSSFSCEGLPAFFALLFFVNLTQKKAPILKARKADPAMTRESIAALLSFGWQWQFTYIPAAYLSQSMWSGLPNSFGYP